MTSIEKFNKLIELEVKDRRVKITTVRGNIYYCKLHCPAEDEGDFAYSFVTPDYPTRHIILNCDFIAEIEEISEKKWEEHLELLSAKTDLKVKWQDLSCMWKSN